MPGRFIFAMLMVVINSVMAEESPLVEEEVVVPVEAPPAPTGKVAKAAFTSAVENRIPLDDVTTLKNDQNKVLFFTDLRGFKGQLVRHVWFLNERQMASVEYQVKGPRWRVWSSKTLLPQWLGTWSVKVMDENGFVLHEQSFDYVTVDEEPADSTQTTDNPEPSKDSENPQMEELVGDA